MFGINVVGMKRRSFTQRDHACARRIAYSLWCRSLEARLGATGAEVGSDAAVRYPLVHGAGQKTRSAILVTASKIEGWSPRPGRECRGRDTAPVEILCGGAHYHLLSRPRSCVVAAVFLCRIEGWADPHAVEAYPHAWMSSVIRARATAGAQRRCHAVVCIGTCVAPCSVQ